MMDFFSVLFACVAISAVALYFYLRRKHGIIEALGIPIDPPLLSIFGSEPRALHLTYHNFYEAKFKKFGKTYGRYDGTNPTVVTKDPELIKSVLVKNFDSFPAVIDFKIADKTSTLDAVHGDLWKSLRKNMSPTFTSGKLKGMLAPMGEVIDKFLVHIGKAAETKEAVEVKPLFEGLALDVIARCAFSIESDATSNPDQEIVREGRNAFAFFAPSNWLETLAFTIPTGYFPAFVKLFDFFPDAYYKLWSITEGIMAQREKQGIQSNDFIARLMELKKEVAKNPGAEYHKALNDTNITAQGVIFFVAGFETTANTLSTFSYELATRPELQEQIYEEVKSVVSDGGVINHEAIEKMEYLEAAIQENLRLNSPITVHARVCMKDCEIAPGMLIKKGMGIEMPIHACHHDETYFPDPEEFRPERFLKENAANILPYTYRPFGGGPRSCIAQRFALNEVKMTVAKLLADYRLVPTDDTKLNFAPGSFLILSYPGLKIKFEKRQ